MRFITTLFVFFALICSTPILSDEPIVTNIKEIMDEPWKYDFKTVVLQGQVLEEPHYSNYKASGYRFKITESDEQLCVFSFHCPNVERGDVIKVKGEFWGTRHGYRHNWVDITKGGLKIMEPLSITSLLESKDWYDEEEVIIKGKVKDLFRDSNCCTFKFKDGDEEVVLFYEGDLPIKNNKDLIVCGEFFEEKVIMDKTFQNVIAVNNFYK